MSTEIGFSAIKTEDLLSEGFRLLYPLLQGKSVAFKVTDRRMMKKKRIGDPILFIVPGKALSMADETLLIALQGGGAEFVHRDKVTTALLIRIGLRLGPAKIMVRELKRLFGESSDV